MCNSYRSRAKQFNLFLFIAALLLSLTGCSTTDATSAMEGTHSSSSAQEDTADSNSAAQNANSATIRLFQQITGEEWLEDFVSGYARPPVLLVETGTAVTDSQSEIVDFATRLERMIVEDKKVRLAASSRQREIVRDERIEQQTEASEDTLARLGREAGADFILIVESARSPADRIIVDASLIDVETSEVVFIGRHEITRSPDATAEPGQTTRTPAEENAGMWQVTQAIDDISDEITTQFKLPAVRGHESYELKITHVATPDALLSETIIEVSHPKFGNLRGDRNYVMVRFDDRPAKETRWRLSGLNSRYYTSIMTEPAQFLSELQDSDVLRVRVTKNTYGREYNSHLQDAGFSVADFDNALRSTGLTFDDLMNGVVDGL